MFKPDISWWIPLEIYLERNVGINMQYSEYTIDGWDLQKEQMCFLQGVLKLLSWVCGFLCVLHGWFKW